MREVQGQGHILPAVKAPPDVLQGLCYGGLGHAGGVGAERYGDRGRASRNGGGPEDRGGDSPKTGVSPPILSFGVGTDFRTAVPATGVSISTYHASFMPGRERVRA